MDARMESLEMVFATKKGILSIWVTVPALVYAEKPVVSVFSSSNVLVVLFATLYLFPLTCVIPTTLVI